MTYILGRRRTSRPLLYRLPRLLRYAIRILVDQEGLLFQPVDRPPLEPQDLAMGAESVALSTDGSSARAWWIPGMPRPSQWGGEKTVLLCPRSTGDPRDESDTLRSLRLLGCNSLVVEYPYCRREATSGRPSLAACRKVAHLAWNHLVGDRGNAPADILLYGRSLGAAFAAELAAITTCGGLIVHNGFSSVDALARDSFPGWLVSVFRRVDLDPAYQVARGRGPVLVLHARDDRLIRPRHGERIAAAAATRGRLLELPGNHLSEGWLDVAEARKSLHQLLAGLETWPRQKS